MIVTPPEIASPGRRPPARVGRLFIRPKEFLCDVNIAVELMCDAFQDHHSNPRFSWTAASNCAIRRSIFSSNSSSSSSSNYLPTHSFHNPSRPSRWP